MKNILVTGVTGFIGSHTSVELLENGYKVIGIDNLYNSEIDVLDNITKITGKSIKFYQGDLLDSEILKKYLMKIKLIVLYILQLLKLLVNRF